MKVPSDIHVATLLEPMIDIKVEVAHTRLKAAVTHVLMFAWNQTAQPSLAANHN